MPASERASPASPTASAVSCFPSASLIASQHSAFDPGTLWVTTAHRAVKSTFLEIHGPIGNATCPG